MKSKVIRRFCVRAVQSIAILALITRHITPNNLVIFKRALQSYASRTEFPLGILANATVVSPTQWHKPQRFTRNVQLNIDRGLNIINSWSGQTISTWIYNGRGAVGPKYKTWQDEAHEKILRTPSDAVKIQANDTIYVGVIKLQDFAREFLPMIQQDFVLITASWGIKYPDWIHEVSGYIVSHPHLLGWFAQDIGNYTGDQFLHPKVSPFPLGLKPHMPGARHGTYRIPVPVFRQIFLETLNLTAENKTDHLFVGFIRDNGPTRRAIPRGENLAYPDFLRALARAHYVISPNGDHPDCHRHYESLGLGTIPITELDPFLYRHLADGPVIFNNSNWNLTSLKASLPDPRTMQVNRNIIFEEYWMEYVEHVVGRPLRWWDVVQRKKCYLDEFVIGTVPSSLR